MLFGAKVPARKFAGSSIDQFQAVELESASADLEKSSISEKAVSEMVDGGIAVAKLAHTS